MFPAYHNGLTLLTERLEVDDEGLHLDGVSVVNGCQSLLAMHANQDRLTPELTLLTKVVELGSDPTLADIITYRSNNQNPVNIRDQRANDVIQRDLQSQVSETYPTDLFYSIRRGEPAPDGVPVFDNQLAAQLITAIWLREPWNAVRKLRLFDEDYRRIFAKGIDAHRLLLAYRLTELIDAQRDRLRGDVSASFAAARFTIAHLVAEVCRLNEAGQQLLEHPGRWLPERDGEVTEALRVFVEHVIDELNVYVESREEERRDDPSRPIFDPKVAFKSAGAIRDTTRHVLSMTRHAIKRYDDFLFAVEPVR